MNTYTPDATVSWENAVAWQAKQALAWVQVHHVGELEVPFTERVVITLRFNMARPKSAPKSIEYPMKGADLDNLEKSVLDALQSVGVIDNDRTVTDMNSMKRFADVDHPEGVEIELLAWLPAKKTK